MYSRHSQSYIRQRTQRYDCNGIFVMLAKKTKDFFMRRGPCSIEQSVRIFKLLFDDLHFVFVVQCTSLLHLLDYRCWVTVTKSTVGKLYCITDLVFVGMQSADIVGSIHKATIASTL
jgi:hypothetical protein